MTEDLPMMKKIRILQKNRFRFASHCARAYTYEYPVGTQTNLKSHRIKRKFDVTLFTILWDNDSDEEYSLYFISN